MIDIVTTKSEVDKKEADANKKKQTKRPMMLRKPRA